MRTNHKKQIEKIMSEMKCSKDFECYKSGFTNLSKVEDIGIESSVKCLAEEPKGCEFSLAFGYSYFCKCPLRVFIAKKLRK